MSVVWTGAQIEGSAKGRLKPQASQHVNRIGKVGLGTQIASGRVAARNLSCPRAERRAERLEVRSTPWSQVSGIAQSSTSSSDTRRGKDRLAIQSSGEHRTRRPSTFERLRRLSSSPALWRVAVRAAEILWGMLPPMPSPICFKSSPNRSTRRASSKAVLSISRSVQCSTRPKPSYATIRRVDRRDVARLDTSKVIRWWRCGAHGGLGFTGTGVCGGLHR